MGYFLRRIWALAAFFLSIAVGAFLSRSLALGDEVGYTLGCIIGAIIWAAGPPLLRSLFPQQSQDERSYRLPSQGYSRSTPPALQQSSRQQLGNPGSGDHSNTPADPSVVYCHNCGGRSLVSDAYCSRCGTQLRK